VATVFTNSQFKNALFQLSIHSNMSLTFTLIGKSSVFAVCYFPAVDLSDGDELGLTDFEINHTMSNVNSLNIIQIYDTFVSIHLLIK